MYIHFKDECLKTYDLLTYSAPNKNFNYEKVKLSQKSKEKLFNDDLDYLRNMKIMWLLKKPSVSSIFIAFFLFYIPYQALYRKELVINIV